MSPEVECCGSKFGLYVLIIVGLVSFAGLMAGLTLGLMSLGLVDLEVLIKAGKTQDRKHACKIFPVVKNQHLLLCTLLIGNSLAMESLPIFLDKLVDPLIAVLLSVTLILMFGEILPQAICTRYGMTVGATLAPFVRVLLILFWPVAYPISKVLDWMLGEGHAVLLRRAELKTFVNFHGNEAGKGGDLTHDETTIITGALELTEKTVKDAMTPISNAFTLDLDGVLNSETLSKIMAVGHSRIPVYYGNPRNIVGLILIKNLFTVDREDAVPLRKMIIRKIPRVKEDMPLYDILNEFQKGHSHIAVVVRVVNEPKEMVKKSEVVEHDDTNKRYQVQNSQCEATQKNVNLIVCILDIENSPLPEFSSNEEVVGVITMEDVIEELLQEEILDETDEYVNIHNRIKVNMHASQEKASNSNSALPASLSSVDNTPTPLSPATLVQNSIQNSALLSDKESSGLFPTPSISNTVSVSLSHNRTSSLTRGLVEGSIINSVVSFLCNILEIAYGNNHIRVVEGETWE